MLYLAKAVLMIKSTAPIATRKPTIPNMKFTVVIFFYILSICGYKISIPLIEENESDLLKQVTKFGFSNFL